MKDNYENENLFQLSAELFSITFNQAQIRL